MRNLPGLHHLNPETILTDFELAVINAFQEVFVGVDVHGCLFHLSQNIYRKVQEQGLQVRYSNEPEFALRIRMLAALAFVPMPNVLDAFESLMETFPMEAIPVADYFEDNYIGRLRRNRCFHDNCGTSLIEWKWGCHVPIIP